MECVPDSPPTSILHWSRKSPYSTPPHQPNPLQQLNRCGRITDWHTLPDCAIYPLDGIVEFITRGGYRSIVFSVPPKARKRTGSKSSGCLHLIAKTSTYVHIGLAARSLAFFESLDFSTARPGRFAFFPRSCHLPRPSVRIRQRLAPVQVGQAERPAPPRPRSSQ